MQSIISDLQIDLSGMRILTEAASGHFSVTPVIAALAGADHVVAVGRTSKWGSFTSVVEQIEGLAKATHCPDVIQISEGAAADYSYGANIVTNLGFVRPIDTALLANLPKDAAISLMWEPWEFRPNEVDVDTCRQRGIPVLGTNENHPRIMIFDYLAKVAQRLLFECDIEVERSKLLLVASDPFGVSIEKGLKKSGAIVHRYDPILSSNWDISASQHYTEIDAVIVAEHRSQNTIVGTGGLSAAEIKQAGCSLIHICGNIEASTLVDVHAAGLAVGARLVRLLRSGVSEQRARAKVVESGLGLDFVT